MTGLKLSSWLTLSEGGFGTGLPSETTALEFGWGAISWLAGLIISFGKFLATTSFEFYLGGISELSELENLRPNFSITN